MPVETHVGPDPGKKCHKCRKVNLSGSKHVFPTHGKLADIALRDPAMPIRFALGAAGAAGNLLRDHRAAASYRVEGRKHACQLPHGKIGRASCRESVCQYVELAVVTVSLKKHRQRDIQVNNTKD